MIPLLVLTSGFKHNVRTLGRSQRVVFFVFVFKNRIKNKYMLVRFCKYFIFMFQIAAKIGSDGVAAPSGNDFGYGGQKRPLEDAGGYFPMPNLNIGQ